jgi:hypothetical protein
MMSGMNAGIVVREAIGFRRATGFHQVMLNVNNKQGCLLRRRHRFHLIALAH